MEDLTQLWSTQWKYSKQFIDKGWDEGEKLNYLKNMLLGLVTEVSEVLEATGPGWRTHIKGDVKLSRSTLVEELVDVFKFWLNCLLLYGVTPTEFSREFKRKSRVMEFRTISSKYYNKKGVYVLDMDGVIADYVRGWLTELNAYNMTSYNEDDILDLHKMLPSMNRQEYYGLKKSWIESGGFLKLPLLDNGCKQLIERIHSAGYGVVVVSNRPVSHKRVFVDTVEFLDKHHLEVDKICFSNNKKYRTIVEEIQEVGPVKAVVEDDLEVVNVASSICGVPCYLLDKSYNRGQEEPGVKRIKHLEEVVV